MKKDAEAMSQSSPFDDGEGNSSQQQAIIGRSSKLDQLMQQNAMNDASTKEQV